VLLNVRWYSVVVERHEPARYTVPTVGVIAAYVFLIIGISHVVD